MADSVQRRGRDTFVNSNRPDQTFQKNERLGLTSGQRKIFVYLPLPGVRKRTIEQATLSVPVKGSWAAQTLTATPIAGDWAPRKTSWNNQPALRGGAISAAQTAKSDGERVEIDVTAHVQAVADGAKHYGWQITTSSTADNRVYGFEAPGASWVLRVDFIEAPEAPTDLSPNGNVVGIRPMLTFDFTDLGGESTELAALNVQVNSTASATGAWDSGEVAATLPEYDLGPTGWPTPTSGSTRYWRVRVKDGAGYWSEWSDWAQFVYAPKPTLTILNPATGLVWDPTPTIAASISAGTVQAYRIKIARGNDKSKVIYDSGKQPGQGSGSIAHVVPFKNERGNRILKDDKDYWLLVRTFDRLDREATPGDPIYTQQWVKFRMDDDVVPPPPDTLGAVQEGDTPRVRLTWTRASGFAEGWVIERDGELVARLDPEDVTAEGTTYTWVDDTAPPFIEHTYTVRAIDADKRTRPSPEAYVTTEVEGVWLLGDDSEVKLLGKGVGELRSVDKRAIYSPPGLPYSIDVVYAFEGLSGTYGGGIDASRGADWQAGRKTLLGMKERSSEEVRMVYGTTNIGVRLRDVTVAPSPDFEAHNMRHQVFFGLQQTSGFEVEV